VKLFSKKQSDTPRRRLRDDGVSNVPESSGDVFRRNRTLSSARLVDNIDPSSRAHVHHLTRHRRRILGILMTVALAAMFLWIFIVNFTAMVSISVPGADISKPLEKLKYEAVVQEYLDAKPLSRLRFFISQTDLLDYVAAKMPEVSDIKQRSMISLGKTDFSITVRQPVAGWRINNQQYYVDAHGVSFANNYFAEPSVQIIDQNDTILDTGSAVVSNRFLSFVGQIVSVAAKNGKTVTEAIIPINTTRELDIKLKGVDILVKLSIDRPVGEQIEDMINSLKYFKQHGLSPKYVDVRVSGKAFYK
jgi:hypothetical protein